MAIDITSDENRNTITRMGRASDRMLTAIAQDIRQSTKLNADGEEIIKDLMHCSRGIYEATLDLPRERVTNVDGIRNVFFHLGAYLAKLFKGKNDGSDESVQYQNNLLQSFLNFFTADGVRKAFRDLFESLHADLTTDPFERAGK